MTEDPYRLDDDLQLSSIDNDFDDEYDGLETELAQDQKRGMRKMPLVLGMMLVVFVSGAAYIAYQMFVADISPIVPAQPPMAVAQQQEQPPFMTDDVTPPEMPQMMDGQDAMMPPVDGMPPMADADMPPMIDGAEADPAVMAEGLLPPPVDDEMVQPAEDDMLPPMADADAALPPVNEAQAAIDPAVEQPAEDSVVADNEAVADVPPVADETVSAGAPVVPVVQDDVVEPAIDDADVAQAPPEALLQPIDPAPVAAVAAPVKETKTPAKTAAKPAKKVDEVQKILESAGIEKASSQPAAPPPPVEVTPRAREVIVVTRSYGSQSPQAALAAGDRVLQAHQYDNAAEIFDNQLRQNPSDPLALAGKALALQKAGHDVEAMNTYERLISLNPRDVEAMTNYLGLLQTQDPQQALVRLENLAQQYPQNGAVAGQLGMLYARMMDTPNAIRYFQTAAALDGTNATYPFNLAVLYDRLGSKARARDEYRRALGLARDYPSRADVSVDVIRQRLHALRN